MKLTLGFQFLSNCLFFAVGQKCVGTSKVILICKKNNKVTGLKLKWFFPDHEISLKCYHQSDVIGIYYMKWKKIRKSLFRQNLL